MNAPLDLRRFLVLPGRRLIAIVGKVDMRSDSVARLLSLLESERIRVCSAFASFDGEHARLFAFLDVTDSTVPVEEIGMASESLGIMKIEEVIRTPTEGFVADTLSHPLFAGPTRAVILRETGYNELLAGIREYYGRSGEIFLYHVGFRAGMGFGRLHREVAEKLNVNDPALIYRNISAAMFQWAGFGRMEVQKLTTEGGVIVVHDSFECELGKYRVIPYSHFVRGMIAGALSELFGRGFNVVEEECIAKRDPYCKFKVRAMPQANQRSWELLSPAKK